MPEEAEMVLVAKRVAKPSHSD